MKFILKLILWLCFIRLTSRWVQKVILYLGVSCFWPDILPVKLPAWLARIWLVLAAFMVGYLDGYTGSLVANFIVDKAIPYTAHILITYNDLDF